MPKKLNEKEKLGLEMLRDLEYLRRKIEKHGAVMDGEMMQIIWNLPDKIKNLALTK